MKADDKIEELEPEVNEIKRGFMKKFGMYAATAPMGMYMLMTPSRSAAVSSGQNNGWGNGDQTAPGSSLPSNQAENTLEGQTHQIHGDSNAN